MTDGSGHIKRAPDAPSEFRRRMAVIMAADVAGYSRLLATGEEDALKLFHQCRSIFDAEVLRYRGRIFNTAGDSVMSEFASAVESVRAAISIQHALEAINQAYPEQRRVQFRIGITVGDIIERDGDLLGDGVNIASRLEALARPGGICVSRGVHDATSGKVSAAFTGIGPQALKNIPVPVEAFMVSLGNAGDGVKSIQPSAGVTASQDYVGKSGHGSESLDGPAVATRRTARRKRRLTRVAMIALAIIVVVPTFRYSKHLLETQLGLKLAKPTTGPIAPAQRPLPPAALSTGQVKAGAMTPDVSDIAKNLYQQGLALEAEGDLTAARRVYIEAASKGAGFIDPLLRLVALVRLRDGAEAARDVFADLSTVTPDRAIRLIYAQQLPLAEQTARLKRMLDEDKTFAPAWYGYAQAIGDARSGPATLARLRMEHNALDQFLAANQRGALKNYFVEPAVLQEWVERASRRAGEINAAFARKQTRPALTYLPSAGQMTVNISLPEDAASVQYRLGDKGGFSRAEVAVNGDSKTSRTASFTMPAKAGKTNIYITYVDTAGLTGGPFVYRFDATEMANERQRNVLLATSGSWLTWATDRDELYFPYLLNFRCAIRSAHVGFDGAEPDVLLPLPEMGCDDGEPPPAGAQNSLPAPHDARTVSVKLVLQNGEAPPPVTITRDQ